MDAGLDDADIEGLECMADHTRAHRRIGPQAAELAKAVAFMDLPTSDCPFRRV
jgi:hypothetical protein